MAIIYSYPKVTTPLATDVLVLTDTTLVKGGKRKNQTKSLALSDLASYVISSTSAITGSGTTNFVSKWLDSDTLQDSIIFDSGTRVGIGTATPSGLLEIKGAQPTLYISNTTTATGSNLFFQTINSTGTTYESFGEIRCGEVAGASGSGNRMRLGFVGGTGRAISIAPNGVGGDSFVGIGTDSPDNNLDVIGGISAQKDGQVFNGKPVTGLASAITEFSNSTGSLEPRIKLVNSTGTTKIVLDGANSPDGGVIFNTTLDVVHDTAIGAATTITNATSSGPTLLLKSSAGGNIIEGGSPADLASFTVNSQGHISSDLTVSGTADFTGLYARFGGQIQDSNNLGGTAGQVLSSTGTGVEWTSAGGGSVTGTGTTNTLPMWSDGPNGVLGDSPISSINSTNSLKFVDYTAIAVATTESLTPNQSNQAPTEDTLAILSVDPDGNVVRGSQEGTWTFTKAQLDALGTTTATGNTLIQAPGADKAVIVEESNWMVKYSGTGAYVSDNSFIVIQSSNITNAEVTRLPSGQIDNIMAVAPVNPSYGFYSRDLPLYNLDGRTYKTNEPTEFIRVNTTNTPANLVSISIKLKYRVFDTATF